jgi:hypothetical protein
MIGRYGTKAKSGLFGGGSSPALSPVWDAPAPEVPSLGQSLMAAPVASMQAIPDAKPSFFGEGGTGRAIGGAIGDFLLQSSGMRPIYAPMMQQRVERQQMLADEERRNAREDNKPRFFENPLGDYIQFDPASGQSNVVYDAPDKPVTPTALEQNLALARRLNPQLTDAQAFDLVKRAIPGAAYDLSLQQPLIDARTAASVGAATARSNLALRNKAAPSYAQLHPKAGGGGRGGSRASATRVVGGKAYYKIGGAWYDNPEGR